MPAVVSRGAGGRGRRSMNEINMVPFIDVMLVLLIIFMVTAPLITTGVVDLPSVGKSAQRPAKVIEVIIDSSGELRLRIDQQDPAAVALPQLGAQVRALQGGDSNVPVVISADKGVRYEKVVDVMNLLQKAQVKRIGLSVKQGAA
jgi:biopolymer transport protein TolR